MTSLSVPVVALDLEEIDPVEVGVDIHTGQAPELINFGRAILAAMAGEPEAVRLVIAGNFVESVRRRLPEGTYRDSFDEIRGAGEVAVKTMVVADEIHVVVPAWLLQASQDERADLRARRTVVHEAQHVAMQQHGEDDGGFADEPWARRCLLTVAHQVIAEYRAELGVPAPLREGIEPTLSADTPLALREDLVLIDDAYQQSLDVQYLAHNVVQQSQHFWKALAYIAAARRVLSVDEPLRAEFGHGDLWEQMGAEHWERFEDILRTVPSAHTRVPSLELRRVTDEMAGVLTSWLESLGFVFKDINGGNNSVFHIVSRHLLRQ
ncbi:hypothetical protein HCX50_04065 [Microbacterium oxydans]|uniref:hypothetical protein n=1 Tax=Microbacterium sp. B19(2022) TaxID=2914045 RepID=UPI0014317B8D|nr:hypothetical protein [Microbacterium sp. B19(2022)]NJI58602.1 hypothetical protein [Microbacterium sp. B19(2022)]